VSGLPTTREFTKEADSSTRLPVMLRRELAIGHRIETHDKIARNAEEISRLHRRVHETLPSRAASESARREWEDAAAEFHARYHLLAFPHGLNEEAFFDQLRRNDRESINWAVCFLELRPYFFRSGYIWKKLLHRLKHVDPSAEHQQRFEQVLHRYNDWRLRKHSRQSGDTTRVTSQG
jgi:hypothetical protein